MSKLRQAIENDNPHQFQLLLDMGHDVNEKDEDGNSLLHLAARFNACGCIPLLIQKGLDIQKRNSLRKTPIEIAVENKFKKFISTLLIELEIIDKNFIKDNKLIMLPVKNNASEILKEFLKHGADIEERNWHGQTPLFIAAENDAAEVAELLIKKGANVNSKDKEGKTALFFAVKESALKTTKLLIENGANVNARDKDGNTPLFNISPSNQNGIKITKLLLENGANVNAKNRFRKTPVFKVVDQELVEVVKLFADYGADFSIRSIKEYEWDDPLTPLHIAEEKENQEIVRIIKKNINHGSI